MDRRHDHAMVTVMTVLGAAAVVMAGLLTVLPYRYHLSGEIKFEESQEVIKNPLIGYATDAKTKDAADVNLVYIGISWAEWEPREGYFDTAALEKKYQIRRWKEEGKHAVLRFYCDYPREEKHMDIPQWLYDKTGDGKFYEISYGKGYCPNYENDTFLLCHQKAIAALADYCNRDNFVSYVELGSLGHWGEWHTKYEDGLPTMPGEEFCWQYADHYTDYFREARFLMRRSYQIAADGRIGIYNDMTGDKKSTEEWLSWTENGAGAYEAGGTRLPYAPYPEFWNKAPVGGEFTSAASMDTMLNRRESDTLEMIRRSHMTFIGPKCPDGEQRETEQSRKVEKLLGYRLWISDMKPEYKYLKNQIQISLTWENTGAAPMYWDWPVMMYVYDQEGELQYWESVNLSLTELAPGSKIVTTNHIPFNDLFRQGYSVGVGILDPVTEAPCVRLAMDGTEYRDGVNMLYVYEK